MLPILCKCSIYDYSKNHKILILKSPFQRDIPPSSIVMVWLNLLATVLLGYLNMVAGLACTGAMVNKGSPISRDDCVTCRYSHCVNAQILTTS